MKEAIAHWLRWACGWRPLMPAERAFVREHFGAQWGSALVGRVHVGVRRWGDTRRALSVNGGWISLPRACFVQSQGHQVLQLQHPQVAGIFAHELLHEVQRMQGLPVTRQALALQCRAALQQCDPYAYDCKGSRTALLRQFWRANVEQQGQMWQDWVQAQVAGQALPSHAALPLAVQRGRLRQVLPQAGV